MDIIDREIVDDSHGTERSYTSHTTGLLVAILLISPGLYYLSATNYLLFHTSVEIVGVLVAFLIFAVGWNTHELTKNNMMLILSVGYLIVGILSIFHTLSYPGMRIFIARESYISTQFWIATRYVEAATLFLAVYFLNRKKKIREWVWLWIYFAIGTIITVTIFLGVFPVLLLFLGIYFFHQLNKSNNK